MSTKELKKNSSIVSRDAAVSEDQCPSSQLLVDDLQKQIDQIQLTLRIHGSSSSNSNKTQQQQILNRLDTLRQHLTGVACSLDPLSSYGISTSEPSPTWDSFHDNDDQDATLALIAAIERTVASIMSSVSSLVNGEAPSPSTLSIFQEQQQQKPPVYDEEDSPRRAQLRLRIELFKDSLFDAELHPALHSGKGGPPVGPAAEDNEIFVLWCAATSSRQYRQSLLTAIMRLRADEECERRNIRGTTRRMYEKDMSAHRRHLQAKIRSVKQAVVDFQPYKKKGYLRSQLPADTSLMDLEVFIAWCMHSSDYSELRKRIDKPSSEYLSQPTYEQALGSLIQDLVARDEEEQKSLEGFRPAVPHRRDQIPYSPSFSAHRSSHSISPSLVAPPLCHAFDVMSQPSLHSI